VAVKGTPAIATTA